MTYSFIIDGRLPGTNDMISAINRNRFVGNKLKRDTTQYCAKYALQIKPIKKPVYIKISWIEPNSRRDLDNICGGIKYILDGLVVSGRLKNDSREYVKGIEHEFPCIDKVNPHVIVELTEEDDFAVGGTI